MKKQKTCVLIKFDTLLLTKEKRDELMNHILTLASGNLWWTFVLFLTFCSKSLNVGTFLLFGSFSWLFVTQSNVSHVCWNEHEEKEETWRTRTVRFKASGAQREKNQTSHMSITKHLPSNQVASFRNFLFLTGFQFWGFLSSFPLESSSLLFLQ